MQRGSYSAEGASSASTHFLSAFYDPPLYPDLPFLAFWNALLFSLAGNSLPCLSVLPFFPKDFKGSPGKKKSLLFRPFSLPFIPKRKERKIRVRTLSPTRHLLRTLQRSASFGGSSKNTSKNPSKKRVVA